MEQGFAALTYLVDQVHKWYMISIFDISRHQPVEVMPGFDLVMVWNYGISYGWFASHSQAVRGILIVLSVVGCGIVVAVVGAPDQTIRGGSHRAGAGRRARQRN